MSPPPRGIFNSTAAVLDVNEPVLYPTALTGTPLIGFTLTVTVVSSGRLEHCTTIRIGFACWLEMTASGVESTPVGDKPTGIPAKLTMAKFGSCPIEGIVMNCEP